MTEEIKNKCLGLRCGAVFRGRIFSGALTPKNIEPKGPYGNTPVYGSGTQVNYVLSLHCIGCNYQLGNGFVTKSSEEMQVQTNDQKLSNWDRTGMIYDDRDLSHTDIPYCTTHLMDAVAVYSGSNCYLYTQYAGTGYNIYGTNQSYSVKHFMKQDESLRLAIYFTNANTRPIVNLGYTDLYIH